MSEKRYDVRATADLLEEYVNRGNKSYTVRVDDGEMYVVSEDGHNLSRGHCPPWAQFDEVADGLCRVEVTNTQYLENYRNEYQQSEGRTLNNWG